MQDLRELSKYKKIADGSFIRLPARPERNDTRHVRLQFNTATSARLDIVEVSGKKGEEKARHVQYLARVDGLDVVTLNVPPEGLHVAVTSDDEVWWYSAEMEVVHAVIDEPIIFTKYIERQPIDPRFLEMQANMMSNVRSFMSDLQGQSDRQLQGMQRNYEKQLEQARKAAEPPKQPDPPKVEEPAK